MDTAYFASEAVRLADEGRGRTGSNPSVGCVVVKDGKIVGRGRTADGGRPHAEATALLEAGPAAQGASVFVTLEPCSHVGRGPSCASTLIAAGVAHVYVGVADPDIRVNGAGIALLKAAGIEVTTGHFTAAAEASLAPFLVRQREGRPFTTLKLAMTLDGKIATENKESKWITNPAARRYVHGLRAVADGVMVGASTARADDAKLTVRGWPGAVQPSRIILTSDINIAEDSALIKTLDIAPAVFIHSEKVQDATVRKWEGLGVTCRAVAECDSGLDIAETMQVLGCLGINHVLCEGGATLAASLIKSGLVDELVTIYAGKLFGAPAVSGVGALDIGTLSGAPRFSLQDMENLEGDLLARWRKDPG